MYLICIPTELSTPVGTRTTPLPTGRGVEPSFVSSCNTPYAQNADICRYGTQADIAQPLAWEHQYTTRGVEDRAMRVRHPSSCHIVFVSGLI